MEQLLWCCSLWGYSERSLYINTQNCMIGAFIMQLKHNYNILNVYHTCLAAFFQWAERGCRGMHTLKRLFLLIQLSKLQCLS